MRLGATCLQFVVRHTSKRVWRQSLIRRIIGCALPFVLLLTTRAMAAPSITSLTPNSGAVGASVTIAGSNFGATQGSSTVKFHGTSATPTSWSATSIVVPVPTGATTGTVVVTVSGAA